MHSRNIFSENLFGSLIKEGNNTKMVSDNKFQMQMIISGQIEHNFKCSQVSSIKLTKGNILEYIKNYQIMAVLMNRLVVDN